MSDILLMEKCYLPLGRDPWSGVDPCQRRGGWHNYFTPSHLCLLISVPALWGYVPKSQKQLIPFTAIKQKEGNQNRDVKRSGLYWIIILSGSAKNESDLLKKFCQQLPQRLIMTRLTGISNWEPQLFLTCLLPLPEPRPPHSSTPPPLAASMLGLQSNLPWTSLCLFVPLNRRRQKIFMVMFKLLYTCLAQR